MDDSGNARIADFGLATVTQNLDSTRSASCQHGYTARWTAPEVLNEGICSKEADVFSFAMVMIEVRHGQSIMCKASAYCSTVTFLKVFTGAIPFSNDSSVMVMLAVTQGRRPPRPIYPTFTENLWTLIQRCWDHDPHSRPEVSEALQILLTPSVSRLFLRSHIH